mmetsp:Transcript_19420/g.25168  ORF Transcript_19420/g.25168 Transcript_19420/m.25168 type:complete len:248 (-) Transcript_19420:238-981(-)|eukprot:CAMPEP_0197299876 /NCGR_PEP_ID=MMETSP0890-20130614/46967_1 /TAXON_ID=44058 ORGANISM="Aureoumbra lagunensis, Strain CCMP1510" /NCGR_SAMPLE_ID=MMETSP0890 /ASSEMBLY_ACC=CAM_ASM_000533 /LENGTH=247 /DNA_ID=CAMNT_0042778389 /DNA_START=74 /DNA_END=817 /DNA_ORIENTATION=-
MPSSKKRKGDTSDVHEDDEAASHLLRLSEKGVSSTETSDDVKRPKKHKPKPIDIPKKPSVFDFHTLVHPNCKHAEVIKQKGALPFLHRTQDESEPHVDFLLPDGTLDCFLLMNQTEKSANRGPIIRKASQQQNTVPPQLHPQVAILQHTGAPFVPFQQQLPIVYGNTIPSPNSSVLSANSGSIVSTTGNPIWHTPSPSLPSVLDKTMPLRRKPAIMSRKKRQPSQPLPKRKVKNDDDDQVIDDDKNN